MPRALELFTISSTFGAAGVPQAAAARRVHLILDYQEFHGADERPIASSKADQMIPPVRWSALGSGTYELDPPHTFLLFSATHLVVGRVDGRFDRAKGTITISPDLAQSSVDVSIDPQSLSTQNGVRDEDLRGPDFFAAVKYPVVTYQGRGVRESADGWVVDGALTIRDVRRTVPLWFTFKGTAPVVPGKPSRIAFYAKAAVKRAEFGMMRELLDEIGFVSNAPDVWITIDAELLLSAPSSL